MPDALVFNESEMRALFDSESGEVAKELTRVAVRVEAGAKRLCPVDTGRLRSSITHDLARDGRGLLARVGSNVSYAGYVEFGTSRTRAQPFLRPALVAEVPR